MFDASIEFIYCRLLLQEQLQARTREADEARAEALALHLKHARKAARATLKIEEAAEAEREAASREWKDAQKKRKHEEEIAVQRAAVNEYNTNFILPLLCSGNTCILFSLLFYFLLQKKKRNHREKKLRMLEEQYREALAKAHSR
jgi:hypothetical protein